MTDDFKYYRPVDVSELMGWSLKTLANYRCEGVGPPYIKVGRKCLYPRVSSIAGSKRSTASRKPRLRSGLWLDCWHHSNMGE